MPWKSREESVGAAGGVKCCVKSVFAVCLSFFSFDFSLPVVRASGGSPKTHVCRIHTHPYLRDEPSLECVKS